MKDVINKVKAMIQWGRQSKKTDDSSRDQVAQVESTGSKPFAVVYVYPYGLSANAPTGCNVVQMNIGGSAKAKVGIPTMMENRFRDLKEWEVAVGNFKNKSHLFFDDDGNIRLSPSATESEDWAVQFSEMKRAFDELRQDLNELIFYYNAHVHPVLGITVGPANISSGVTTSTGTSSTASMDAARVDNVRLP